MNVKVIGRKCRIVYFMDGWNGTFIRDFKLHSWVFMPLVPSSYSVFFDCPCNHCMIKLDQQMDVNTRTILDEQILVSSKTWTKHMFRNIFIIFSSLLQPRINTDVWRTKYASLPLLAKSNSSLKSLFTHFDKAEWWQKLIVVLYKII